MDSVVTYVTLVLLRVSLSQQDHCAPSCLQSASLCSESLENALLSILVRSWSQILINSHDLDGIHPLACIQHCVEPPCLLVPAVISLRILKKTSFMHVELLEAGAVAQRPAGLLGEGLRSLLFMSQSRTTLSRPSTAQQGHFPVSGRTGTQPSPHVWLRGKL